MDYDYLIEKKPLRALLLFALPMIVGNLFQQTYTMADSAIAGRYVGERALAAVGASYSLTNVFICVAIGGGIGASVVVSRYFGAKAFSEMKTAVFTALLSFLALSILLGGAGFFLSRPVMRLLNTPADVLDMAAVYLNIYFLGLPFLFMYNVLSAMFNALGKSRIPLYFLIFSSVFNIALDLWMVRGLHMGVEGVAWATLIAQGVSAALSFGVLLRTLAGLDGQESRLFDGRELLSMSGIALPSILQQSTVSIGMMLVQSVVNSFGYQALAGYSAAMRVESICIVPMSAMGNALSSYTAQNLGAGRAERVREGYRAAVGLVLVFGAVICAALELSGPWIARGFLGEDGTEAAVETAVGCLSFMGWFFCLIGFKMTADGVLRGAGDMKLFTAANLLNLTVRVLAAVTLAPVYGIAMVWTAVPAGWAVNWLISYGRYRTGKWENAGRRGKS
ncbi:MAG: MATE family efflux transporter [Eubacteriales bacterium]|nr:MATE family efflux transporter [Eubacteriales bacterium]